MLVTNDSTRKTLLSFADKKLKEAIMADERYPLQVREDKYYLARDLLLLLEKAYDRAKNAPAVRKAIVNAFISNIYLKTKPQVEKFKEEFGQIPPGFLLISPGKLCNLRCVGCYANSTAKDTEKLSWDVLNRIIDEKTNYGDHILL